MLLDAREVVLGIEIYRHEGLTVIQRAEQTTTAKGEVLQALVDDMNAHSLFRPSNFVFPDCREIAINKADKGEPSNTVTAVL